MAPFSRPVGAGSCWEKGPPTAMPPNKCAAAGPESQWHTHSTLRLCVSDPVGILNILSQHPFKRDIQKGQAWILTFGSNNTLTKNTEYLEFPHRVLQNAQS